MQIIVNRIGENITGSYNGKSFGVSFSQGKYNAMKELEKAANNANTMEELRGIIDQFEPLTHESYKEVIESISPYLVVNNVTNQFFLRYNKEISEEPIPERLAKLMIESTEKGMDIKPLVKCWARFLRNPNYSQDKAKLFAFYISQQYTDPKRVQALLKEGVSPERANDMATTYQTPITEEGLICTYKVSREITKKFVKDEDAEDGVKEVNRYDYEVDEETGLKTYANKDMAVEDRKFEPAVMGKRGDAFQLLTPTGVFDSEGHLIKVGFVHALKDWSMVNCDDRTRGVPGLHCGNLDYIRSYQQEGTVTHYVLVDPMHIGAIVQDNTGALRVKQYMVYASFAGVNKGIYHSATYGKLTDAEYEKLVQESVEATMAAAQKEASTKRALIGDGALDS